MKEDIGFALRWIAVIAVILFALANVRLYLENSSAAYEKSK